MPGIFISYRREDSTAYAGRLYDRLTSCFGRDLVFMDIGTLDLGVDFVDARQQTVASCDVLITVIGKHWLQAKDECGRSRLDNPEDLVRIEINAALNRGIRVMPVLVGDAAMPRSVDLPNQMASLARRNALDIRGLRFSEIVNRLIESWKRLLSEAEQRRLAERERAPVKAEQWRLAETEAIAFGVEAIYYKTGAQHGLVEYAQLPDDASIIVSSAAVSFSLNESNVRIRLRGSSVSAWDMQDLFGRLRSGWSLCSFRRQQHSRR